MLSRKKKGLHYRSQEQSSSDWRSVQEEKETKNKPTKRVKQKKKWLTGSQQSETAFIEHSKLWLRTHRHTHEKKKECQEHAFHFSESSFLFPFSFSKLPSQWLASSLHFSKYCLRKKKRCCDPSRKGTPHCRARKQRINRASWKSKKTHQRNKKKEKGGFILFQSVSFFFFETKQRMNVSCTTVSKRL